MMSAQSPLFTLLLLTADSVAAERLIEHLRAQGLAARGLVTSQADRLDRLLSRNAFDIIVWWMAHSDPEMAETLQGRRGGALEIPLVMVAGQAPTEANLEEAKRLGARDLLPGEREDHLIWCIAREAADLRYRRYARELAARLRQCEERAPSVSEPVALQGETSSDRRANDPLLNGVVGRAMLMAEIESRLGPDRAVPVPFMVLFVRVTRYTDLLRELGLTHGLTLVDAFADVLESHVDEPHVLARLCDDGFGMILDRADEKAAEQLGEHIRTSARFPEQAGLVARVEPECELGYTLVKNRAASAEDILNAAHRLCIYRSASPIDAAAGMQTPTSLAARTKQPSVNGETELAEQVSLAFDHERFSLVYQPIISLMGDNQENYSVLVRLIDDQGELIEAKDFIGAAIRRGLIEKVDKWAISAAIAVLAKQREAGHRLRFFINLAEDTFRNPSIILHICDCLRNLDVRGNWLAFQFQEELIPDNMASLVKLIEALRQIKCRIAINRFGATERSEMILKALPADFVVLMPALARGLADDPSKQERLATLAKLAQESGTKSIVTGVEDARALTVLWTAGVDYVQGNFLQRPSPTLEIQS
jgi:EAL domain-containing protein (putative c-di-GMP-specific phosphodiesterase class I)/GGDEF domain-containing protein